MCTASFLLDPHCSRAENGCRWWLFDGAAVSAFFVVIIVALTVLLALRYMLLTRRSLSHPRSAFGRGLMVATGLFAALHFVNIGTHVSMLALCLSCLPDTEFCASLCSALAMAAHFPVGRLEISLSAQCDTHACVIAFLIPQGHCSQVCNFSLV